MKDCGVYPKHLKRDIFKLKLLNFCSPNFFNIIYTFTHSISTPLFCWGTTYTLNFEKGASEKNEWLGGLEVSLSKNTE